MDIGTLCSLEMFSLHLHQQFPDEMVANTLKLKVGGSIIFVTLDFKQWYMLEKKKHLNIFYLFI